MDNLKKESVRNEEPAFVGLLNALRREVSTSQELSNRNRYFSNNLKAIPLEEAGEDRKEIEPQGVIELLWVEVWKLRRINSELQKSVDHLANLIGS